MITPSPTSKIDPSLARGVLAANVPTTAKHPAHIVLEVPNTSYQLHLIPAGPIATPVGKRLIGKISVKARRIDVVGTGGQYIEPVLGRPRRIQGTVIGTKDGAVIVDAGVPVHSTPMDPRQSADQFQPGQFVSFDAEPGATFTP
jgi:hypothetical protein